MRALVALAPVLSATLCSAQSTFCSEAFRTEPESQSEHVGSYTYKTTVDPVTGGVKSLKLDVYRPVEMQLGDAYPVVVLLHGGGFVDGSRDNLTDLCGKLAEHNAIAVTMDYRLGWDTDGDGDNDRPGQDDFVDPQDCQGDLSSGLKAMYRASQDIHSALTYVIANRTVFGVDTAHMYLGGYSAGGIAALHYAFGEQSEFDQLWQDYGHSNTLEDELGPVWAQNTPHARVQGILVVSAGVYDLDFVDANENVAVLSLHGLDDRTVPSDHGTLTDCVNGIAVQGSQAIAERRRQQGFCNRMLLDLNGDHENAWLGSGFTAFANRNAFYARQSACFFRLVGCANWACQSFPLANVNCSDEDCTSCTSAACNVSSIESLLGQCPNNLGLGQEENTLLDLAVFPNPAHRQLSIDYPGLGPYFCRVSDAAGRSLLYFRLQSGLQQIDISQLAPGPYVLSATNERGETGYARFVRAY
jgi:dienelactone hydrolase